MMDDGNPAEFGWTDRDGTRWTHPPYGVVGSVSEWGTHMVEWALVCPRCAALVWNSEDAKAAHEAFHERVEPGSEFGGYRRVQTPLGKRIAWVPVGGELPSGWADLGPYGPEAHGVATDGR